MSYYVALASLELTYGHLADLELRRSICLCLMSAGIYHHHPRLPGVLPPFFITPHQNTTLVITTAINISRVWVENTLVD